MKKATPDPTARTLPLHVRVSTEELHAVEELQRRFRDLKPSALPPSRTETFNRAIRVALGELKRPPKRTKK